MSPKEFEVHSHTTHSPDSFPEATPANHLATRRFSASMSHLHISTTLGLWWPPECREDLGQEPTLNIKLLPSASVCCFLVWKEGSCPISTSWPLPGKPGLASKGQCVYGPDSQVTGMTQIPSPFCPNPTGEKHYESERGKGIAPINIIPQRNTDWSWI